MDCLNFIFGLRAIHTTGAEEKQLFPNYGDLNGKQESDQKKALLIDEHLEDEDDLFSGRKKLETNEVIF